MGHLILGFECNYRLSKGNNFRNSEDVLQARIKETEAGIFIDKQIEIFAEGLFINVLKGRHFGKVVGGWPMNKHNVQTTGVVSWRQHEVVSNGNLIEALNEGDFLRNLIVDFKRYYGLFLLGVQKSVFISKAEARKYMKPDRSFCWRP